MTADSGIRRWAEVSGKLHQWDLSGGATVCGLQPTTELDLLDSEGAMARVRATSISVCGTCEKVLADQAPSVAAPERLTAEQQKLRSMLDDEQRHRAAERELASNRERRRSESVRAASAGLPTLGRKK